MYNSSTQDSASQWQRYGAVGAALLLVVVFALARYHYTASPVSFNTDICYCPHFCEDLLLGNDMRGWHLPVAPYLFPDMTVVAALIPLSSNIGPLLLIYSALFYLSLLAVLVTLFHRVGIARLQAFTAACLGLSLMLASCYAPEYKYRSIFLFYPANHMSCLLVGLGATALVVRALVSGYTKRSAALLVLLCGLTALSDHLLIVQFMAPITAAALFLSICRLTTWRRTLLTIMLLGSATLFAMVRESFVRWLGMVPLTIKMAFRMPGIDVLIASFEGFWASFGNQWLMLIVLAFHMAAALTVTLVWLRRHFRAKSGAEIAETALPETRLNGTAMLFVSLVLLLAPLSSVGALIITDMPSYSKLSEDRYLYTLLLFPFLFVALWPRLLSWRPAVPLVSLAVIGAVMVRLITFPDELHLDRLVSRYPPVAQALDDMVRKHGRLRGFAEYWHARELHYLTQEKVDVLPIMLWGQPRFHGYNPNTFLSNDRRDCTVPDYHFILMSNSEEPGPDPEHILALYGKPAEIIRVKDFDIWRYERMNSRNLDLFLRAQVAQRLVEQKPFIAPSEPRSLAQPKRNLTSWDSPDNVKVSPGSTLSIHFDKPVHGAMIDIAANYSDRYTLTFFSSGKMLGEARVPTVDWSGAEIGHYCDPGLQARLVAVPAAVRKTGFDEVRVLPSGSSGNFAIGHFLVFDEWLPYRSSWSSRGEEYRRYEGEDMMRMESTEIRTVEDPSASAGQARQSVAEFHSFLAYGPYLPMPPGRYRVDFALKVDDNSTTDKAAVLDACALGGARSLQVRTLHGTDFSSTNKYQIFSLTFDLDGELDQVEYRVQVTGKTRVTLDYVDVTRLPPEQEGQVGEQEAGNKDIWP